MSTLETLKAASFVDGDVVQYAPRDTWCHHGIAIVHIEGGKTWALDTYWGPSPTDGSYVEMSELAPASIIGNTHTFDKVPYPHEYEDFADSDKYWVPMGGGSAYKRVRVGALPVPEKVRERLVYAVEKAEYAVKSAGWNLERAQKELAALDEAIAKLEAQ
jgi:hypothetical protein